MLVERKYNLIQEFQITSIFKGYFREQSVRISDPWGKSAPRKIVKFYFCLKHPRMTTADVQGEVVSALVLNSMWLLPKNEKCPFIPIIAIFPELHFYFLEVPLSFPQVSFYSMCVSFKWFFPRWLYFLLVLLRAAQRDYICLGLKTSTWSMISYAFYSSFILHDSL